MKAAFGRSGTLPRHTIKTCLVPKYPVYFLRAIHQRKSVPASAAFVLVTRGRSFPTNHAMNACIPYYGQALPPLHWPPTLAWRETCCRGLVHSQEDERNEHTA